MTIAERQDNKLKTFFIDGAGSRPDGTGSGFAWVRTDRERYHSEKVDGLTNNQAEYAALLDVLRYLAFGSRALIFTDSQLVAYQFSGKYGVHDPKLRRFLARAKRRIARKELEVEVRWISREENLAGKYLDQVKERPEWAVRGD